MNRQTATQTLRPKPTAMPAASGLLQRQCACGNHTMAGGKCGKCTKKRETSVQCSPSPSMGEGWGEGVTVPPIVHKVLRSPGQPLDRAARAYFEPRFERDFTQVRVHTDAKAAEAAQAVNALAYTVGKDVVFGVGQYAPETVTGKRLLAHELTHIMQQAHHLVNPRSTESVDSHAEREAQDISARIGGDERAQIPHAVPAGITRDVGWARRGPIPDAYGMGYNTILSRAGLAAEPAVRDLASCENARMGLDVLRFQSLSLARRRAVLALQPHAAGTGCEPWFPQLDPARLTDAQIEVTDEFRAYMDAGLKWQSNHGMTREEALLAGRLILRELREGRAVSWSADAAVFMNRARARLAVTTTAEGAVGTQKWVAASAGDVQSPATAASEFTKWMLAAGKQPDPTTGRLNCWEMVLFSAFRAGHLSEATMRGIYTRSRAAMSGSGGVMAFPRTLERELRSSNEYIYDPANPNTPRPLRGDLVIFREAANHVALATGRLVGGLIEIVSHWPPPDGNHHVKLTTIEALLPEVGVSVAKFWSPIW